MMNTSAIEDSQKTVSLQSESGTAPNGAYQEACWLIEHIADLDEIPEIATVKFGSRELAKDRVKYIHQNPNGYTCSQVVRDLRRQLDGLMLK